MLFLQHRAGVHWTRLVFGWESRMFWEEDWQKKSFLRSLLGDPTVLGRNL